MNGVTLETCHVDLEYISKNSLLAVVRPTSKDFSMKRAEFDALIKEWLKTYFPEHANDKIDVTIKHREECGSDFVANRKETQLLSAAVESFAAKHPSQVFGYEGRFYPYTLYQVPATEHFFVDRRPKSKKKFPASSPWLHIFPVLCFCQEYKTGIEREGVWDTGVPYYSKAVFCADFSPQSRRKLVQNEMKMCIPSHITAGLPRLSQRHQLLRSSFYHGTNSKYIDENGEPLHTEATQEQYLAVARGPLFLSTSLVKASGYMGNSTDSESNARMQVLRLSEEDRMPLFDFTAEDSNPLVKHFLYLCGVEEGSCDNFYLKRYQAAACRSALRGIAKGVIFAGSGGPEIVVFHPALSLKVVSGPMTKQLFRPGQYSEGLKGEKDCWQDHVMTQLNHAYEKKKLVETEKTAFTNVKDMFGQQLVLGNIEDIKEITLDHQLKRKLNQQLF